MTRIHKERGLTSEPKNASRQKIRRLGLILGPAMFSLALVVIPLVVDDLPFGAVMVLATTFWMGAWWITEAIPIYVTALLPLVIFPSTGVVDIGVASANYADSVVFLFLGGFLIAKTVEKTGLHRRFALVILKTFGTTPKYIVAAFMVVTGFLSAWMSNTATALLMLPIAAAVISQFSGSAAASAANRERFGTCLMLSVAYSASIGGMATLIGTPPNAIFASLSQSLADVDVTFAQWTLVAMPISGLSLFVAWLYMVNLGARVAGMPAIAKGRSLMVGELAKLGRMDRNEKIVLAVFVATAIAWISRGLVWKDLLPMVGDSTIAIAAAVSLFSIPWQASSKSDADEEVGGDKIKDSSVSRGDEEGDDAAVAKEEDKRNSLATILDWQSAVKIPWGVLLLIGGGLALANGFTTTGLDGWIADQLGFLAGMHYVVIILAISAVTVFAGEVISNTATAALFIPISASLAASLGIPPVLLMAPITLATSYGFVMPVGTPPNAIVFASGHVTAAKMARAGLPLDIIGIVIVTLMAALLVPLVWK